MEKKKFASIEQKMRLIELVESDPQLKSGKFSSTFTKSDSKKRWMSIADDLNSITGAKKTWEEWRKTWQDRKANAKKKFSSLRKQSNMTGGGPPPNPPTLEESIIMETFDQQLLVGHNDSQESLVTFFDLSNRVKQDNNSPLIDLTFANEGGLVHQDATPNIDNQNPSTIIDPSQINSQTDKPSTSTTSSHLEDKVISKTETTETLPKPQKRIFKTRKPVAQRRLEEGLQAAQALNKSLVEKNEIQKKFYEDFLKLMSAQTQALADIASALKDKSK